MGHLAGAGRENFVTAPKLLEARSLFMTGRPRKDGQLETTAGRRVAKTPPTDSKTRRATARRYLPLILRYISSPWDTLLACPQVCPKLMRFMARERRRIGVTTVEYALVGLVLIFGTMALAFVTVVMSNSQQLSTLQSEVTSTPSVTTTVKSSAAISEAGLPVMNQTDTIRQIRETWYLSPAAHQDRFDPSIIVVNQGDTIDMTLIDDNTVAHDFVIGPPYNIIVNATVPGLVNDITGKTFTTPAKNGSPGSVVSGTPGNVSATYTFVAKYAGTYEFVCTYHAEIGMIGTLRSCRTLPTLERARARGNKALPRPRPRPWTSSRAREPTLRSPNSSPSARPQ